LQSNSESRVKNCTLVQTDWADGDSFQIRKPDGELLTIRLFVETAEKMVLATELVRAGLARAYGVSADGPEGRSRERYKEILADIELQAAKRGEGIWAATDRDKLPAERDIQRIEDEEDQIAQGNNPLPTDFRLNPNTASRDDLDRMPKVGEALADRIIEARDDARFEKPEDLMRVPGIKQKTLDGFRQYLDFNVP
jgi:DNA uptake protein ComE-like DNA-binding protein